jgi:hypothetical protein
MTTLPPPNASVPMSVSAVPEMVTPAWYMWFQALGRAFNPNGGGGIPLTVTGLGGTVTNVGELVFVGGTVNGGNGSATVTIQGLQAIGAGTVLANLQSFSAVPVGTSVSNLLDSFFGTAQGTIIFRGVVEWEPLAPGSLNQILTSGGPGADVFWANPTFLTSVLGDGQGNILGDGLGNYIGIGN